MNVLRRLLHPVRSAKSLYRRLRTSVRRRIAEYQFRKLGHGQRDRVGAAVSFCRFNGTQVMVYVLIAAATEPYLEEAIALLF
jgi:hypothetical protein